MYWSFSWSVDSPNDRYIAYSLANISRTLWNMKFHHKCVTACPPSHITPFHILTVLFIKMHCTDYPQTHTHTHTHSTDCTFQEATQRKDTYKYRNKHIRKGPPPLCQQWALPTFVKSFSTRSLTSICIKTVANNASFIYLFTATCFGSNCEPPSGLL